MAGHAANEKNGRIYIDSLREVRQHIEAMWKQEGMFTSAQRIGTQVNVVQEGLPPEVLSYWKREWPESFEDVQRFMFGMYRERDVTPDEAEQNEDTDDA